MSRRDEIRNSWKKTEIEHVENDNCDQTWACNWHWSSNSEKSEITSVLVPKAELSVRFNIGEPN